RERPDNLGTPTPTSRFTDDPRSRAPEAGCSVVARSRAPRGVQRPRHRRGRRTVRGEQSARFLMGGEGGDRPSRGGPACLGGCVEVRMAISSPQRKASMMISGRRRAWLAGLALSSLLFSAAPATAATPGEPAPQVQPFSTGITLQGSVDLTLHSDVEDFSVQLWRSSNGLHKVGDAVPVAEDGTWSIPGLDFDLVYYAELLVAPGAPVLGGFYAGEG